MVHLHTGVPSYRSMQTEIC